MKTTVDQNRPLADSLAALDSALGVTGNEEEVIQVLKKEMEGLYDEYRTDPLGNQYFIRYGKNRDKRVLFAAHMDEIGFIIKSIDDRGFARFYPVGWHDDKMAVNQDLVFLTAEGRRVYGVTGAKPAHLMTPEDHEKAVKIRDLFVDFGTESAEETRALGIEIGDYGTFHRPGVFLNGTDYYSGKSVDNRAGLAVLVEAARRLKGRDILPTVCFAGTVQEEVGMRGGHVLAAHFAPELMFAVDGTLTGGTPGLDYEECPQKMGGGVSFKYYDWEPLWTTGNNVPRRLTSQMIAVAKKHGIPFQREVIMGGGTDAWSASIAGGGILAGGICIPMRYIHTAVGTVKLGDLAVCADYIAQYLQDYAGLPADLP